MESSYGSFHRSFTLPENANTKGITANRQIRDDNPLQQRITGLDPDGTTFNLVTEGNFGGDNLTTQTKI
jgi:hypothetical protein